jgi:hypothetical protein
MAKTTQEKLLDSFMEAAGSEATDPMTALVATENLADALGEAVIQTSGARQATASSGARPLPGSGIAPLTSEARPLLGSSMPPLASEARSLPESGIAALASEARSLPESGIAPLASEVRSLPGSGIAPLASEARPLLGSSMPPLASEAQPLLGSSSAPLTSEAQPLLGSGMPPLASEAQPLLGSGMPPLASEARSLPGSGIAPLSSEAQMLVGSSIAPLGEHSESETVPKTNSSGSGVAAASVAKTVLESGLGLTPLIGGLIGLFSGGDSDSRPPLTKYVMPPSLDFQAADSGGVLTSVSYDQMGTPRALGGDAPSQPSSIAASSVGSVSSPAAAAPAQTAANTETINARWFMDHSADIAAAVRNAMLNLNSINDVVNDL